jgi:D-sedoheptulose 7-phosphate isomerase
MRQEIIASVKEAKQAIALLESEQSLAFIEKTAEALIACFKNKGKVLVCGNGGSLCDAMHFAEELTGFYRNKRPALAAIALSDPGHISCVANDLSYDQVFARGIEALGQKGDVCIVLTTSGNSPSIVQAAMTAKKMGLYTIAFLGKTGGKLKGFCDIELLIEGFSYSDRIQEVHMAAIHIIIERVEKGLFPHDL